MLLTLLLEVQRILRAIDFSQADHDLRASHGPGALLQMVRLQAISHVAALRKPAMRECSQNLLERSRTDVTEPQQTTRGHAASAKPSTRKPNQQQGGNLSSLLGLHNVGRF